MYPTLVSEKENDDSDFTYISALNFFVGPFFPGGVDVSRKSGKLTRPKAFIGPRPSAHQYASPWEGDSSIQSAVSTQVELTPS